MNEEYSLSSPNPQHSLFGHRMNFLRIDDDLVRNAADNSAGVSIGGTLPTGSFEIL